MEKLKIYATYSKDTLHANFAIGKDDRSYCLAFIDELTKMCIYAIKKKKEIAPILRNIQSQKIVRLATIDLESGNVSPDYAVVMDLKDFALPNKEDRKKEKECVNDEISN